MSGARRSRTVVDATGPTTTPRRSVRITRYASRPDAVVVGIGGRDSDSNAKATAVLTLDQTIDLIAALWREVAAARTGDPTWDAA